MQLARLIPAASLLAMSLAAQHPRFEVVAIKANNAPPPVIMETPPPANGRLTFTRADLKTMIGIAYGVKKLDIVGGPSWLGSDRFDVSAITPELSLSTERYHDMLQAMLEERFHLATHRESRQEPVYTLLQSKAGKLLAPQPGTCTPAGPNAPPPTPQNLRCGTFNVTANHLEGRKVTTKNLAAILINVLGRPVTDHTSYSGTFDVRLDYARESTVFNTPTGADAANADPPLPSIFTALQEQLGLKLESQKGTVEVLVVDRAEKPSAN